MKILPFLIQLLYAQTSTEKQPNIIYILADDLGWADVNWNNKAINSTPFLESLLSNGKHAFKTPHVPTHYLDTNLKLLPQYLKEAGYSTHMVGKWHLGWQANGTLPLERGFDSFYGILGAEFHPFLHSSGRPMLYDDDVLVDQTGDHATYLFSDRANEILRKPSDDPKFIYLSYTAPHAPHYAPEDLRKVVRQELEALNPGVDIDERFVIYQAMIRGMDIGVEQLHKTAHEITDRETIIIFGSDNGAANMFMQWASGSEYAGKMKSLTGCNYPLKGKKSSINEGGVRIPLLLTSTKRQLAPIKRILNHSIDWFATMLELAKVENIPENIDGVSLAKTIYNPELSHKESKIRDRLIIGVFHQWDKLKTAWKIQFAVIFKGYKFFNIETEPTKKCSETIYQCPVFKMPNENILGFKNEMIEQRDYFRHVGLVPQKTRKDTSAGLYALWQDPAEQKNLIGDQSLKWVKDEAYAWMRKEMQGVPLPVTSDSNVNHSMFYRKLMPNWKNNPVYDIYEWDEMCQVPRQTSKYQSLWSYKEFGGKSDDAKFEGCEKTLAWSNHKGPNVLKASLKKLESMKGLWPMTARFPEFNEWRKARQLKVYNHVSFY